MRCDLFCTVVDNFGDIGVCWRLARQLAAEHGWRVRLWVDDLASFARLQPEIDPAQTRQRLAGVDIWAWTDPLPPIGPDDVADVVIEAFACDLPEIFQQAMTRRTPLPVWINLEYLSAEDWVEDCHLQLSVHPRLGLRKTFFFPGVTPATGGLLREHDLLAQQQAFSHSDAARARFWQQLGLPPRPTDAIVVSLFAYENPVLDALLAQWRDSAVPIICLVPQGRISPTVAAFAQRPGLAAGETAQTGALTLHGLPFVPQNQYDRILWSCDVNFVRGEDSFVRAQWAGSPFIWHIYPQHDAAHERKLEAFVEHYTRLLGPLAARALRDFWHGWNGSSRAAPDWTAFIAYRAALQAHAERWRDTLASQPDLCSALVKYCENQLK